ncbi:hypothetical protein L1987_89673 [Smallanthus sonchifolius]|nr:hypothetical protein L1987_89673 [Smallanthus sonchifolius]
MVRPIPRNAPSIEAYGSIFESIGTIAVAYNFGPNGRPSNLSEWGIPVGNNHGSSLRNYWAGRGQPLVPAPLSSLRGRRSTVGNSRYKQLDRRGPALLLFHRGAVRSEKQGMSWAVPSSGVKCDAVPGRLNQISISVQREGVYYGQCSEICGTNHAFMRAPGKIGRLLSPLWLSRTTQGASHPRSKLLQRAAGAVWSRGARQ